MKILIIAYFFPPQNSIASLRPYSWAKYWSRNGHDVTVLTVPKKKKASDSPQSYKGFKIIEVPVRVVLFLKQIFQLRNIDNSFSPNNYNSSRTQKPQRLKLSLGHIVQLLQNRFGIFASCRMPDLSDFWSYDAYKFIKDSHWDLVVSTGGPYGVHLPAYRLKKKRLAKYWICDWRDLWSENHIYPGLPLVRWIERFRERRWSLLADEITTVSNPLADRLRQQHGDKVRVIYNGFDPDDFEKLPEEPIFPRDGIVRIVYTGTIYRPHQNPAYFFKAIRLLCYQGFVQPDKLRIIFCGNNADVSHLASIHMIDDFIEYAGFVPRQQALRMQRDADFLLFLEFESRHSIGVLTGKLFEYLYAGPPIIGIGVNEDSSVGKILKDTQRGKCLGKNPYRIANELRAVLSSKSAYSLFLKQASKSSGIFEFTRENQSRIMLMNTGKI